MATASPIPNTPKTSIEVDTTIIKQPKYIIAIGASAGGLEEIISFFDHTPIDGVSYVIVQHLSPDFKSRMAELLARHSKLAIQEAENGMAVQCNQVYLIPNDKFMTLQKGRLYLSDKGKGQGPNLTINTFFNSLAVDRGTNAIGVVLSGLGSDGTEGVKAIKEAGGMVIARDPETSEFGSMPSHAIATGLVDFILEPALMPDAIEDYVKQEKEISSGIDDEKNLADIIALIKEQSPLDFSEYKQPTILRRIKKRAINNNFTTLENYLGFLKTTPGEVEALAKEFLISVTAFFRDPEAYEFLQSTIIPEMLAKLAPGEELKLWVAGCATGEEAYSLAILIREQLKGEYKDIVVKIFATDIDSAALIHARNGIYKPTITKNVSPDRLEKYFIKEGNGYKVNREIREMVIFAKHDLVKNPPYCNMHFISCRNLLIYMTPTLQKKIYLMLLFGLKKNGFLFLGSSENPLPIIENLEILNKDWKIYKNLETKRAVRFESYLLPDMLEKHTSSASREDITHSTNNTLAEAVNATLVEEMDYLAVCVDENNRVVKTYGDTTKYLLQKNFNTNLEELLPRPLAVAFNTLSSKVYKTHEKVSLGGIKIKPHDSIIKVTLSVSPLRIKKGKDRFLLVTFCEDKSVTQVQRDDQVFDESIFLDQYTMSLEEKLKELKDELHSAYERLDASNENLQSYNEEILSANEEMQSTNEEMQAVNEELHTINADSQLKNKELQELNDDLNNYFKSNSNGQLFVDKDLLLIKFSPGTVKHMNLNKNDIGRPITDITNNLKLDTMVGDIKHVTTNGVSITKEIEATNGNWYQIMTMPYTRMGSERIEGAVISFGDITELKRTQQQLNVLLDKREEFMGIASHELKTPITSLYGFIQVLVQPEVKDNPELYKDILARANNQIQKLIRLIDELLDVSRIVSGNMPLNMSYFNLNASIEEGLMIVKNLDARRPVTVNGKKDIFIDGDKNRLEQVINNLLTNAVKYSPPQSEIIVETRVTDSSVEISVTDKGVGVPKEKIPHLFDRFYRADKENMNKAGLGMGLYIANEIAQRHKGKITVVSEVGKGSTFTLSIPKN
jgi:two-component system, chemotaxis family, CheB/CheR fusion protein